MSNTQYREVGATLLRLTLGTMWIAHAAFKWSAYTIDGFAGWLVTQNLPAFMAWPVFLLELTGGILLLLGIYGRYVSLLLLPILLAAIWVHLPNGWLHTSTGGGWEYPAFLIMASIIHFFIGDGKLTVNRNLFQTK